MPLVEPPGLTNGQVFLTHLIQDNVERGLGAGQLGRVGQVELVAGLFEGQPAVLGLFLALAGELGVKPEKGIDSVCHVTWAWGKRVIYWIY